MIRIILKILVAISAISVALIVFLILGIGLSNILKYWTDSPYEIVFENIISPTIMYIMPVLIYLMLPKKLRKKLQKWIGNFN